MTTAPQDLSGYAGDWTLDPDRSSATFHTKAMWVLPVKGTARISGGGAQVGAGGDVQGRLSIDAGSITTGMKKRDQHLQTADFFDTATYPSIDFELTGARLGDAGRAHLDGRLTIHGTTRPVTLDAAVTGRTDEVEIDGTVEDLDRSDWGLTWAKMGAGLHNRIEVRAVFIRPSA